MQKHRIKQLYIIATIFFGINTIIPISVLAQTSGSSTVGQSVDASGGALTMPCSLGDFELTKTKINQPGSVFKSYYINPKVQDTDLTSCGGSGITVQDTRYNGGFVLQVASSAYSKNGTAVCNLATPPTPNDCIDIDNFNIVTQQVNTSYIEDSSNTSSFSGSSNLIAGSTVDNTVDENTELTITLPFDFTYYGTTYSSSSTLYVCTNGTINFTSGECDAPMSTPEDILQDTNGGGTPLPRILPYYKDLTTDTNIDASYGVFADTSASPVRIHWKGAPCIADDTVPTNCEESVGETVEFEVLLTDNSNEDTITYNYSANNTDTKAGPIIGVTKGGSAGSPTSNTYTESRLSSQSEGKNAASKQAKFSIAGTNFTESVKPGTSAVVVATTGSPSIDIDYTNFTEDSGNPGNSLNMDLMNGNTDTGCGRVGIYTIYPSYRLDIPRTTNAGLFQSTITYTLSDSTGPGSGSC